MPPVSEVEEANPPHLSSNSFLVNLAVSLNVISIPLAIFLLILILITCILFAAMIICMVQSCMRSRYVTKKKKKPIKSIYLDEVPGLSKSSNAKYGILDYTIEYTVEKHELKIAVMQASGLYERAGMEMVETYVTVALYQRSAGLDRPLGKMQKTAVRKRGKTPTWNEVFVFTVAASNLKETVIVFSVYDYFNNSQDLCVGTLEVPLKGVDQGEYTGQVMERTEPLNYGQAYIEGVGQLCIGLTFYPNLLRLDVNVFEARQIQIKEHKNKNDLDVEVELKHKRSILSSFHTKKKNELTNPYFNEKISFNVKSDQIANFNVVCRLRQRGSVGNRKKVGKCIIGHESEITTGVKQWDEMLKTPTRMHVMWHTLSD